MRIKRIYAYNFHGGGACPTQFFWNNEDKTKYYYFRYRGGHWTLKECKIDIENANNWSDKDTKLIAEGYEGDFLDGFCDIRDFNDFLLKEHIVIIPRDKCNVDYINL